MTPGKKKEEDPAEYVARKDYKKAIALYRDRLNKQPKNTSLRLALADTLLIAGQKSDAISEYKTLAAAYTTEGFLVKAIAIYKKILKLNPDDADAERLLSELSEKRQDKPAPQPSPFQAVVPDPEVMEVTEFVSAPLLEIETKLFKDLSPEEFRNIVSSLSLHHYEQDTIVVQEGDPGESMFIVVSGQVRVLTQDPKQNEVLLANLGEGEFFGEVAMLTGKPRTATIITNLDSELLELTRVDYEKIIARYPHVKQVMEEFHQQRAYKTIEAMIQSLRSES